MPSLHWLIVFKHNSWVHAADASKPPPMQFAGSAANVVFVAGAYAKQSKKEIKTSVE